MECGTGHARTMRCVECCSNGVVDVSAGAHSAWSALWSTSTTPLVSNKAFNSGSKSLTFGQCDLSLFAHVMHAIKTDAEAEGEDLTQWEFVDLGSGMGRVVFAAHLLCSFHRSVGIELVQDLHAIAQAKLEVFLLEPKGEEQQQQRIRFVHGDILEQDWAEGGEEEGERRRKKVIFVTSTCFTDELFERVARKAGGGLEKGGWLVTFTKEVPPAWGLPFVLRRRFSRVKVNWGSVSVFLYKKEEC